MGTRTQTPRQTGLKAPDQGGLKAPDQNGLKAPDQGGPSEAQFHGSLVEVRGLGVLILGPSGVGKSECVIELVRRGHCMVADDVVRLRTSDDGQRLLGRAPVTIRHYIEVRGLGLLSVADLFGPESVRDESEVGFVCRLESWQKGRAYERIGLERPLETFLGLALPTVTLPVQAASNLATLVELAARDWMLREAGVNAALRLDERLRGRAGILDPAGGAADSPVGSAAAVDLDSIEGGDS